MPGGLGKAVSTCKVVLLGKRGPVDNNVDHTAGALNNCLVLISRRIYNTQNNIRA